MAQTTQRFAADATERLADQWVHQFQPYGGMVSVRFGVIAAGHVRVRLRVGGANDDPASGSIAAEAVVNGAEQVKIVAGTFANPGGPALVKLTGQRLSGTAAEYASARGVFG